MIQTCTYLLSSNYFPQRWRSWIYFRKSISRKITHPQSEICKQHLRVKS